MIWPLLALLIVMSESKSNKNVHPNVQTPNRTFQADQDVVKPADGPDTPTTPQQSRATYEPISLSPVESLTDKPVDPASGTFPYIPVDPMHTNKLMNDPVDPEEFAFLPSLLGRDSVVIARIVKNIIVYDGGKVQIQRYLFAFLFS